MNLFTDIVTVGLTHMNLTLRLKKEWPKDLTPHPTSDRMHQELQDLDDAISDAVNNCGWSIVKDR